METSQNTIEKIPFTDLYRELIVVKCTTDEQIHMFINTYEKQFEASIPEMRSSFIKLRKVYGGIIAISSTLRGLWYIGADFDKLPSIGYDVLEFDQIDFEK